MKVEVDVLVSPSLIFFMVSIESRGGRPGLPSLNIVYGLYRK